MYILYVFQCCIHVFTWSIKSFNLRKWNHENNIAPSSSHLPMQMYAHNKKNLQQSHLEHRGISCLYLSPWHQFEWFGWFVFAKSPHVKWIVEAMNQVHYILCVSCYIFCFIVLIIASVSFILDIINLKWDLLELDCILFSFPSLSNFWSVYISIGTKLLIWMSSL